jgi:adenosine deaminase
VEIRFAPASHTRGGLAIPDVIAAVVAGVRAGVRAVDGAGVAVRLITIAMRTDPPERSMAVARAAADAASDGVVGFDLAGLEATAPDLAPHLPAFRYARHAGLGISVHAGEWGGAAQVRAALAADPDRIAHGGPAADDPELMLLLIERDIALDLCPTSNVQAGLVSDPAEHPLPRLLRAGVPVTLSTDDRTVSATDLVEEGQIALGPLGLTRRELVGLQRRALRVAFLHHDETLRARLLAELDAWVAAHEETITG